MTKPRVLALVEWYLPGENAGGPVRSIDALVHRLEGRVHFDVVTRDRDLGHLEPYAGVSTGTWLDGRPGRRRYLTRRDERPLAMLRLLRRTPHDVVYLNTLFSAAFALYPLLFRRLGLLRSGRVVLAPRGQLSAGALGIRGHKKRAYLTVIGAAGLLRNVCWHASSAEEAAQIRRLAPHAAISVATNLRRTSTPPEGEPSAAGQVRLVFAGRISEMKNLDGALVMLRRCTATVEFDIYGPLEDERHWRHCQSLIAALPANVTCRYHGPLSHTQVTEVFGRHDILLLPTHGENFAHVIGEAMEAGCLPLVSDRTPWRGLAASGAGWDLPLDEPAAFTAVIDNYARFDRKQRLHGRRRAREFAARQDADPKHVAAFLDMLGGAGEC